MEMKIDINDEWIDSIMVAKLKSDYKSADEGIYEDSKAIKHAIVTLMSLYMTYEDYFKWREEANVSGEFIGLWDEYRASKEQ